MSRLAAFWSFLDDGRCRLCLAEGRTILIADLPRVQSRGDSLRARHALINHCRSWHPTLVGAIEAGEIHRERLLGKETATSLDNIPAIA